MCAVLIYVSLVACHVGNSYHIIGVGNHAVYHFEKMSHCLCNNVLQIKLNEKSLQECRKSCKEQQKISAKHNSWYSLLECRKMRCIFLKSPYTPLEKFWHSLHVSDEYQLLRLANTFCRFLQCFSTCMNFLSQFTFFYIMTVM